MFYNFVHDKIIPISILFIILVFLCIRGYMIKNNLAKIAIQNTKSNNDV